MSNALQIMAGDPIWAQDMTTCVKDVCVAESARGYVYIRREYLKLYQMVRSKYKKNEFRFAL